MKYDAIVVAGGSGKRANLGFNKVLFKMKNAKTVLENACHLFIEDKDCLKLIVVTNEEVAFNNSKVLVIKGGKERYDSVKNGLEFVDSEYVFVHDGARPFLSKEDLENLKDNILDNDGAILAYKAFDTVKYVEEGFVLKTINRDNVYLALTPQAFKSDMLKVAYKLNNFDGITDDASLFERCGYKVKIVLGSKTNKKLTEKDDFLNI